MTAQEFETLTLGKATLLLRGRTIVGVRFLTSDEARDLAWSHRPLVLQLDDGTLLLPQRDAEGNGAGSLMTDSDTLPVIGSFPVR
jgi:hypothetical protein